MSLPRCAGCGARLLWARTPRGATMPINPTRNPTTAPDDPRPNVAAHRTAAGTTYARVLTAGEEPAAHEWLTYHHAVTCTSPPDRTPRAPAPTHAAPRMPAVSAPGEDLTNLVRLDLERAKRRPRAPRVTRR